MSIPESRFVASIPAIAGFIGGLLGVILQLAAQTRLCPAVARKLPVICGIFALLRNCDRQLHLFRNLWSCGDESGLLPRGLVTGLVRTQRHS